MTARQSNGGSCASEPRTARTQDPEDFDFTHQRSVKREVIAHLCALDFIEAKDNVVFLGPPGTGKTHLAPRDLGIRACHGRASRGLRDGRRSGSIASPLPTTRVAWTHELTRLGRFPLLVIDEVGYIPFEPQAANLFFQLVSSRYERASVVVTSNKPFSRWGEVFGDPVVAAAMIDRLVHHAEIVSMKGDSYRLKDRDLGRGAYRRQPLTARGVDFDRCKGVNFRPSLTHSQRVALDSHPAGKPPTWRLPALTFRSQSGGWSVSQR